MKLKKIVAALLSAAVLMVFAASCGNPSQGASSGGADSVFDLIGDYSLELPAGTLINDGKLMVGSEIGYPPFEDFDTDGTTPIGLDIDIGTALAQIFGVEVEFVNTAFDGIFDGLKANKYDVVLSGATITAERLKEVIFSDPYVDNYQCIVIHKGSDAAISDYPDLAGKAVGVQVSTTSDETLTDWIDSGAVDCKKSAYDQILNAMSDLKLDRLDAVLCDSSVADGYVARDPDSYEIVWVQDSDPEQFGIAIKMENTELQAKVNEALAHLEECGFMDAVRSDWLS